jgi:hypothetical protein
MNAKVKYSFLIIFLLIIGCKSASVREIPVRTETRVIERLVPVRIPADSAAVRALLECDSMNRVRIKELSESKSKGIESDISLSTNEQGDAELNYNVKTVPDTVYIPAKDSIIYKDVPVYVTIEKPVNFLTGWQWAQVYLGRLFLILACIAGIYVGFKVLKKKYFSKII